MASSMKDSRRVAVFSFWHAHDVPRGKRISHKALLCAKLNTSAKYTVKGASLLCRFTCFPARLFTKIGDRHHRALGTVLNQTPRSMYYFFLSIRTRLYTSDFKYEKNLRA